jgi:hypothetical protein
VDIRRLNLKVAAVEIRQPLECDWDLDYMRKAKYHRRLCSTSDIFFTTEKREGVERRRKLLRAYLISPVFLYGFFSCIFSAVKRPVDILSLNLKVAPVGIRQPLECGRDWTTYGRQNIIGDCAVLPIFFYQKETGEKSRRETGGVKRRGNFCELIFFLRYSSKVFPLAFPLR